VARIGDMLVAAGFVTDEQVAEALKAQKDTGRRLGEELVALGFVTEVQLTQVLSNQFSVPWVNLYHVEFSRELLTLLPASIAEAHCCIPVYKRVVRSAGETLFVAMDDPTNEEALRAVRAASDLPVKPMVAAASDIRKAIEVYYFGRAPRPADRPKHASRHPTPTSISRTAPKPPPPPKAPTPESIPKPEQAPEREEVEAPPEDLGSQAPPPPEDEVFAQSEPPRKPAKKPKFITLTLLDGTTVRLPAPGSSTEDVADDDGPAPAALTASDLVSALLARAQGANVDDILPDEKWEALFATLLSLLIRKGLIADWEFVEAWKKNQ